jgi:hypothetical protein
MSWLQKSEVNTLFTFLIFIILIVLIGYENFMYNKEEIRQDWINKKCNLDVMPFAGWIHPELGKSTFEVTFGNFTDCINDILSGSVKLAMGPLQEGVSAANKTFGVLANIYGGFKGIMSNMSKSLKEFISKFTEMQFNILIPLQYVLIKINDIYQKINSVLRIVLNTIVTGLRSVKAFFQMFVDSVNGFLYIVAAFIATMWALVVPTIGATSPIAIGATVFFVSLSIPLGYMKYWLDIIFNIASGETPPYECFDADTSIMLRDGSIKKISEIIIGDTLIDGGVVTAKIKLNYKQHKMYNIDNTIVSGTHSVMYKNDWIPVENHPNKKPIKNYHKPYLYCLNTSTKRIIINNTIFSDWDEIDDQEWYKLMISANKHIPHSFKKKNVHPYLDAGLDGNTPIEAHNGKMVLLKNIKTNDILKNGIRVAGIVEIDGLNLKSVREYQIGTTTFIGAPNQWVKYLGNNFTTLDLDESKTVQHPKKLYHIITDKKFFHLGVLKIYDYNSAIELFLSMNYV